MPEISGVSKNSLTSRHPLVQRNQSCSFFFVGTLSKLLVSPSITFNHDLHKYNSIAIPLSHFWISGEKKYFYLVSPPGNWFFFPWKSLTGGWEIIFDQPNFQEGYKIEAFIFATGGSTCHILALWRKGIHDFQLILWLRSNLQIYCAKFVWIHHKLWNERVLRIEMDVYWWLRKVNVSSRKLTWSAHTHTEMQTSFICYLHYPLSPGPVHSRHPWST